MAVRASSDNLSLDIASDAGAPPASVVDFAEVWAHRESLRQACTRLIGDPSRAEDLVQETFLSALKSGRSLERRESMGPWLATVARRRSIDELRGRRKLAVVPAPPEPEPTVLDDPAEQFLSSELVSQLRLAIADLSPRERQLLLRQAHHGLSLSELAAEEETSVASVRSVLTRARQKVRMSLERGGALGGLPLPRWLLSLREKTVRWALLWEPSLPSLTGAGAQVTSAIVAVVTAMAMLLGNGTPFGGADERLAMIANAVQVPSAEGDETRSATAKAGAPSGADGGSGASRPAAPHTTSPPPLAPPLAGGIPLPTLPPDDQPEPNSTSPNSYARSETGGHVYGLGRLLGHANRTAIYKSTDNGVTWSRVAMLDYNVDGRIILPPSYPAKPEVFIATSTHLLRSDDGGSHFVPVAPIRGPSSVMVSPDFAVDHRFIIAGTPFLAYNVAKSQVEPLSMPNVTFPSTGLSVVAAGTYATDKALLIGSTTISSKGAATSAVYRCTPAACGPPVALSAGSIVPNLLRTSSGVIYTQQSSSGFASHRSLDDGASFQLLAMPPNFEPKFFLEDPSGGVIAGGVRFPGGAAGIFRTLDHGGTWAPVGVGTDMGQGARAIVALETGALVGSPVPGTATGVRCSHDLGMTWSRRC